MIDKLNNLNVTPDPEVWSNVSKHITKRVWMRRTFISGTIVAVFVTVGFLGLKKQQTPAPELANLSHTTIPAQVESSVVTPSVEVSEPEVLSAKDEISSIELTPKSAPEVSTMQPRRTPTTPIAKISTNTFASQVPSKEELVMSANIDNTLDEALNDALLSMLEEEVPSIETATKNAEPTSIAFWIPNIFSPNAGSDDIRTFKVHANQPISEYQIFIYARNGRLIYTSTDINQAWDGKKNGSLLPQAAYVYVIKYKDSKGYPHTTKGTVTLVH